jgi:hypothetical protein
MNSIGPVSSLHAGMHLYSRQNKISPDGISSTKQNYNELHFRTRYVKAIQDVAGKLSKTTLATDEKYFKFNFSEPNFSLKPMDPIYTNETVAYFTEEGLERIQVFLINELIYDADLNLYNSTRELNAQYGDGEMIVMDRLGNMFIAPKERGLFHHSSFLSGKPVAFAALCFVKEGKVINLVRYSGHYIPEEREETSFRAHLDTNYLVKEQAPPSLKLDDRGGLVLTIPISSTKTIIELMDIISALGGFQNGRVQLVCEGKIVPTHGPCIITIAESFLKNGSVIYALEARYNPTQRIFPIGKFELKLVDM